MFTQLKNRKLWFDGDSSYDESQLTHLLPRVEVKWVDELTTDIEQYNSITPKSNRIQVKKNLRSIIPTWNKGISSISMEDILDFISYKHHLLTAHMDGAEIVERDIRLAKELYLFTNTPDMIDMLKSIIYVVTQLVASNQLWGVGRGRSGSSYILYVIGAHDVDSYMYGLDITDFIPSTK